jgi:hypothetical protein
MENHSFSWVYQLEMAIFFNSYILTSPEGNGINHGINHGYLRQIFKGHSSSSAHHARQCRLNFGVRRGEDEGVDLAEVIKKLVVRYGNQHGLPSGYDKIAIENGP